MRHVHIKQGKVKYTLNEQYRTLGLSYEGGSLYITYHTIEDRDKQSELMTAAGMSVGVMRTTFGFVIYVDNCEFKVR